MQNISKRLIGAIIVFIIAIVAGGWFWYASIREKQAQEQQQAEIALNANEVWYPIPELGIKMKLNKEFAQDLMYSYDSQRAILSTENFSNVSRSDVLVQDFDVRRQHYGEVRLSLRSLLFALSGSKHEECLESALGALGTIERVPQHSDGTFNPSFVTSDLSPSNTFSEHQDETITIDEADGKQDQFVYKKLNDGSLVMWSRLGDFQNCYDSKNNSFYKKNDGNEKGIMEYEVVVPNYQGLGSKTITDGFKDMQSL